MKNTSKKSNMLFSVFMLYSFYIFFCSCEKNSTPNPMPQLPPITMDGKNTFGCKVNGDIFLPYKPFGDLTTGPILNFYYTAAKELYIAARANQITYFESVKVYAICPDTGIFNIVIKPGDDVFYSNKSGEYHDYELSDSNSYNLIRILKLDTLKYIIAGTFQFTGYDPIKKDSVYITEGRFDIKYKE